MEVVEFEAKTARALYLPLEETLLMPIGDVQFAGGGPDDPCDVDRFQRHIEWGMKRGAYFLGMGDYLDVASPSNRAKLEVSGLYDSLQQMIQEAALRQLEKFQQMLKGTEGRWLGLLEGHHFIDFDDGTTTDTRLAQYLGAPFLGDSAFVRMNFVTFYNPNTATVKRRAELGAKVPTRMVEAGATIWCHHGVGSGRSVAAPLTLLEHITKAFEADIYLMGHQHKKIAATLDRIYVNWKARPPRIEHRKVVIGCTGGFLRGYMQGMRRKGRPQGTYVEQRMLAPTQLGGLVIYIRPRRLSILTGTQPTEAEVRHRQRQHRLNKGYHLDLNVEQ